MERELMWNECIKADNPLRTHKRAIVHRPLLLIRAISDKSSVSSAFCFSIKKVHSIRFYGLSEPLPIVAVIKGLIPS